MRRPITVSGRLRSIQSDQKIARMDDVPILHANVPYDPGFKRLQDLDLASWNQLALGRGDNVDVSEPRPRECSTEEGDNGEGDASSKR